ncbi:ubiquitin-conjugating enzyme/RWD-like protein [Tricladium varicosporioides]|nr:ubiquitin-conjugating enzyme/RWD-like protein [Hymenoscyphus varicosporioides]
MVPQRLSGLSAVRKQHLLVEFSSLKYACPHGVFVSLTPGDPTLWSGVIFVRKGPYAPSILRFQISFPSTYPALPPLVTFSTDIFHPLITPLTTYMYTTDIQDSGTVSATDEERLPPGGFSLRHGFPGWFGRASRRSAERSRGGNQQTPTRSGSEVNTPGSIGSGSPTPGPNTGGSGVSSIGGMGTNDISTYEVLRYIRSTFDDESVLDSVPLNAAGNPGAWHAWHTHQIKLGKINSLVEIKEKAAWHDGLSDSDGSLAASEKYTKSGGGNSTPITARRPGEWNWDGVWEVRVKKGVDASVSEAVLYGASPGDDLIRFLHMDADQIESVKENIRRSLEVLEPQRRGVV